MFRVTLYNQYFYMIQHKMVSVNNRHYLKAGMLYLVKYDIEYTIFSALLFIEKNRPPCSPRLWLRRIEWWFWLALVQFSHWQNAKIPLNLQKLKTAVFIHYCVVFLRFPSTLLSVPSLSSVSDCIMSEEVSPRFGEVPFPCEL